MRQRQYVPTGTGEVHSAAKKRNEHREEKITEAGRGPDQRPVGASGSVGGGSGHGDVIVYCFRQAVFSREFVTWFQRFFSRRRSHGKRIAGRCARWETTSPRKNSTGNERTDFSRDG